MSSKTSPQELKYLTRNEINGLPKVEHDQSFLVKMTKPRANQWQKASKEAFFKFLEALANIYYRKWYNEDIQHASDMNGKIDENMLFKDFKQWRDKH